MHTGKANNVLLENEVVMKTVPTAERLLYIDEVATILRRTPASLRFMIQKGTAPPSAKISGRRMFRESDVMEWVEAKFEDR